MSFELTIAANPGLGVALEACGYTLEERNPLMIHRPGPDAAELEPLELDVVLVDSRSTVTDIVDAQRVQGCAFASARVLPSARAG